jgi:4-carboxymuconolactone decarboxylase
MRGAVLVTLALTSSVFLLFPAKPARSLPAQTASGASRGSTLPPDVDPVSRNRLPPLAAGVEGAAAIRLHVSSPNVRWASPLGRALTELAILTTAREHDQPYEWSLHEMEALAVGLEPSTIDIVRHRRPLTGLAEKEAVVIGIGREIAATHRLGRETYARAVTALGRANLVDIVNLMATYAATATRLSAFNQHMPPGWKQFLPLPFTPPADVHPDSQSRLPLIRATTINPQANLYARQLAPEGTGPNHIARHAGSLASLEASRGKPLMALAGLVTAREHHSQYDWTTSEATAAKDGLDPRVIDIVRLRQPLDGVGDGEAALIQFGRELFAAHHVSAGTYARALKIFGERDLVDLVGLMAQHAGDAMLLAAFDQQLPPGQQPRLPAIGDGK